MRIVTSVRLLILTLAMLAFSGVCLAQFAVGVSVSFAPPELPVYEQPLCPGDGYIWTPGYWAWDEDGDDYYWVPGTWVLAPEVGYFWTPGYWGWGGRGYYFHAGYWGPVVGFYGGINYGYGYFGHGYEGGRWDDGRFFYNRSVNNVNVTEIRNIYNTTVINNRTERISYNGGNGGINDRPTAQEETASRERHIPPVAAQTQHLQAARSSQELRASVNHGKPAVAATPKPAVFTGTGVVAAKSGGNYNPPPRSANPGNRPAANESSGNNSGNRPPANSADRPAIEQGNRPSAAGNPVHPKDLPPTTRPTPPNTGNPKTDKKYQQQQDKMYTQQEKDHQKLQQKQDQQHQKMVQQQQDAAKREQSQQQLEQQHQQQTQKLEQKHTQQQQQMQTRQQPPHQQAPPPHQQAQQQQHPNPNPPNKP